MIPNALVLNKSPFARSLVYALYALLIGAVAVLMSGCFSFLKPETITAGANPSSKTVQAEKRADLAHGYLNLKRLDIATIEIQKALELDIDSAPVNNVAGLVMMESDKFNDAEWHFKRAIKNSDNNPNYVNNLGLLYCRMGRRDEGLRMFEFALKNKIYQAPYNSLLNAGDCLSAVNRFAEAENYYRRAEAYPFASVIAKQKLANVYLLTGRAAQSWAIISKVVADSNPPSPEQYALAVRAAAYSGQTLDAQKLYQKLKADYPDSPELNAELAALGQSGVPPQPLHPVQGGNLPSVPKNSPFYPQYFDRAPTQGYNPAPRVY